MDNSLEFILKSKESFEIIDLKRNKKIGVIERGEYYNETISSKSSYEQDGDSFFLTELNIDGNINSWLTKEEQGLDFFKDKIVHYYMKQKNETKNLFGEYINVKFSMKDNQILIGGDKIFTGYLID